MELYLKVHEFLNTYNVMITNNIPTKINMKTQIYFKCIYCNDIQHRSVQLLHRNFNDEFDTSVYNVCCKKCAMNIPLPTLNLFFGIINTRN